ncbi:MAG: metallophosphoesterase family protein [Chloroflexota bacterium]
MKIAVFSDMHGNCTALDAMLDHLSANPADKLVCLGDTVQGGPQPHETLQRLRELGCPVIMGNADAWMLSGVETSATEAPPTQQMQRIREWSLKKLNPEDVDFINTFLPTVEISLEGRHRLLCFHGSPRSFDDVFLPETPQEEFEGFLGEYTPAIMTGGHTHLQYVRRLGSTFYFNPGSVGRPFDRHQSGEPYRADPWVEYAVLTSTADGVLGLEFRRVLYDTRIIYNYILNSDMPDAALVAEKHRPLT